MDHKILTEKLEELDKSIDEIALEKRLEIESEHLKRIKTTKILRLYFTIKKTSESFNLIINTRVLNNTTGELKRENTNIWSLIKRFCIGSDIENENNEDFLYEWYKDCKSQAFIIKNIDLNKVYTAVFKFKNPRKMFKLKEELSHLFNIYSDTKQNIIKEFYKYINNNNLSNHHNSIVVCDDKLKNIFNLETIDFNNISNLIDDHLLPIENCFIKLDDLNKNMKLIYDIEIITDDINQMPVLYPSDIKTLEKKIEGNKILDKKLTLKIENLNGFVEDPINFINRRLILEKDIVGIQTKYFEDLDVQSALFELLIQNQE